MTDNTLFLRFEGAMQAWGGHEAKFAIRRVAEAPTKSGVFGLLCSAMGVTRQKAVSEGWLSELNELKMGVRIDRPGVRWWDFHTVGAKQQMQIASGKTKPGAMLTRREYLCDASFLVALQGNGDLVTMLFQALCEPKWTLYLGRKCCPPSRPILAERDALSSFETLQDALTYHPWQRRIKEDKQPSEVECLLDYIPTEDQPEAPEDAEIHYDVATSFDPPHHIPRFVIRKSLSVGKNGEVSIAPHHLQNQVNAPPRPRANYTNSEYKRRREDRLDYDHRLCVFCKSIATTVQHITYRHAGGQERREELKSLCRLCHDACTMLEYGQGMGLDRIDPEDPKWREDILKKRREIINHRSKLTNKRLRARSPIKSERDTKDEEVE